MERYAPYWSQWRPYNSTRKGLCLGKVRLQLALRSDST